MFRTNSKRSSQIIKHAVRSVVCEAMEARRMLAGDAVLAGGVVTITGTGANDNIEVKKDGSKLKVKLSPSSTKEFTYSSVNSIVANLFGGNDVLLSYNSMQKPMVIYCGSGNDVVYSGGGDDQVFGESGNDWANTRDGSDTFDGGSGTDTADYSDRTYDLEISLDNIANDGGANSGADNMKSTVETILGGSGNDILKGDDDANYISGGAGKDTVWSYGGNDTVDGGDGDDALHGQNGNDSLRGGGNNDKLYGENDKDTLLGGNGNDTAYGGSGNDLLKGEAGNDKSYGDSGTDIFNDGAGIDYHEGGSGSDSFYVDLNSKTESDEFKGGSDFDWIFYNGRTDGVRIQQDGVANDGYTGDAGHAAGVEKDNVHADIEGLYGTDKEDGIYAGNAHNIIYAGKGNDYIAAGEGNDTVYAGEGDDWVFGQNGHDSLRGESGKDSLDGGAHNDTLNGGSGKDSMYGQGGNDKIYAQDGVFSEIVHGGSGTDWADIDTIFPNVPVDALSSIEAYV